MNEEFLEALQILCEIGTDFAHLQMDSDCRDELLLLIETVKITAGLIEPANDNEKKTQIALLVDNTKPKT